MQMYALGLIMLCLRTNGMGWDNVFVITIVATFLIIPYIYIYIYIFQTSTISKGLTSPQWTMTVQKYR